jgi:hypothetical protein
VFVQVPLLHASAVQGLSSLQSLEVVQPVQLATGACVHPCAGSHASAVHESLSLQFGAVPALHAPAWHVSPPLHWLPSLQEAPSALLVNVQPLDGLHESLVHGFTSLHVSGVPPAHAPP